MLFIQEKRERYQRDFQSSMPYTKLDCGHELLNVAEARLQTSFETIDNYQSHKFSPAQWYVQRKIIVMVMEYHYFLISLDKNSYI